MVDIDERVVSMKFDSNDFEKKSKTTLNTLDQLNNKLSFKDADKDSNDVLNRIADNVEKMASKSYDILDMWKEKIKNNIINELGKFLRENTIGQLEAGWTKYADMTTSVATLKGQGYAMKDITDQLERLNYFTDETSYNFTSMVSEIGKFTASGQSLEDATTAMMGIAEWAALSGKNASEASRAMYQLSQALGAGEMRLQDYKSIQNLNMDTIEFRKNAIEAAIAAGTLKDNLNGTYTSLVNSKVTFSLQNFAESLTKGKWFNSEVMMTTYKKYSQAVDEIRDIYEEGSFVDAQGNYTKLNTTAEAVKLVQKNNEELVKKFSKTSLGSDEISKLLAKWKKVEKVTEVTAEEYAAMDDAAKEQLKTLQKQQQANYAEYLKEYAETFTNAEKSAEEALEDWHTYVSEYGVKAFLSAQEAKTFRDAIESAKDAASTVWTTIYTNVFGNYDEARELWTDLANSLYEIFVERLWDLNDVFEYWRTGGASALEDMLDEYEKELKALEAKGPSLMQSEADQARFLRKEIERISWELENDIYSKGERTSTKAVEDQIEKYQKELEEITAKTDITEPEKRHIEELRKEIKSLNEDLENNVFIDGRTRMFQGLYAFGAGFKSLLENIRTGWDQVTEDNIGGKRMLSFSEKLRTDGLRFYKMMKDLGNTSFFRNISQGIKNLFSPITGLFKVIGSAIGQFLPQKQTLQDTLTELSTRFREITEKIRPSEETLKRLARIFRGIISVFRLIGKAALGVWNSVIKPIFDTLFGIGNDIFGSILEIIAQIADTFFEWEDGVDEMEAMAAVGSFLKNVLSGLFEILKQVITIILKGLAPIIKVVVGTIKNLVGKIKDLIGGGEGNLLTNIADGFKNIGDRAKNAWRSTESLADVFNRFRGGSGIGNFLNMLVAMLDNVITKIGNTIAAILGINTELEGGKVGHAINSLKDVFYEVGTILKWLYTNVIRPTLFLLFEGVAACLKDIGDAFKEGDILHIFEVIIKSIKTIGALELFKVISAISKVIGSGGLLKVIRNGAKTIKQIGKYFAAKTMNEISTSILKFVVALGALTAVLVALSFLPTDNLNTIKSMLIGIGIAMGIFLAAMIALTKLGGADNMWDYFKADPIQSIANMFWAMTASILATIAAIYLLKKAFDSLWYRDKDENGNEIGDEKFDVGGLLSLLGGTLGPVIAVLTVMGIIKKILKGAEISKTLTGVATILLAVSASILALVLSLKVLANVLSDKNVKGGSIVAALLIVLALLTMVTAVTYIIAKSLSHSGEAKKSKAGFNVAIAVVAMMVTTALVIMPLIEDLVQNADKFGEYMKAVAIFATLMISIAASFFLMTVGTKNGGHILAAGVVFLAFVWTLKHFIMPIFKTLATIDGNAMATSVGAFAVFILAIAGAFRIIIGGITELITGILLMLSKFPKGTLVGIILSLGAVIAGIILLCHVFSDAGTELSAGAMIAVFGTVMAILLGFGVFAKMLANSVADHLTVTNDIVKILQSMTLFFGVLTAGMIGLVVAIKLVYKEDWGDAITILGIISSFLLITLVVSLIALSKGIESIGRSMRAMRNTNDIQEMTKVIIATFIAIGGMIVLLTTSSVLLKLVYTDSVGYIGTIATVVVASLVALGGALTAVGVFLSKVPNFEIDSDSIKVLMMTFIAIGALILEVVASAMILESLEHKFESIVDVVVSVFLVIFTTLSTVGKFINSIIQYGITNNELATISIVMVTMIVIIGEIALLLVPSLNQIKDVSWDTILAALGGVSLVIGVLGLVLNGLGHLTIDASIPSMIAGMAALMLSFWGFAKIVPEIFDALNKFKGADATDLLIALGAILIPFYFLTTQIMAFSAPGVGEMFLKTAAEIALGIGLIAAALAALTSVGFLIKELFGIGETSAESFKEGFDDGLGIKSPSREMKKDVKYIVQGLVAGMKQATNRRMVINSSTGLATLVNDSFCDTLGIASPSKVFYENGRFVVRGFINGMGDETNKNKKAGADMAEGFADGMDKVLSDAKGEWAGLWDGLDFDEEAEKAGESGAKGFWQSLKETFLGEDTDELTDAEKKVLEDYEKNVETELEKWNKSYTGARSGREYEIAKAKAKAHIQNELMTDDIKAIQDKQNKKTEKSSQGFMDKITGIFTGGVTDMFSGNSDLMTNIGDGLGNIKDKVLGFIGDRSDGSMFSGILDIFTGDKGVVDAVEDKVIEAVGGENGAAAQALKILNGDTDITNMANTLGDTIGGAIVMGISNALTFGGTPIQKFLDFVSGEGRKKQIYNDNQTLFKTFDDYLAKNETSGKYSAFTSLLSLATKENDNIALTMEDIINIFQEYKKMVDSGVDVKKINLTQSLLHMANAKMTSYNFDTEDLLSHSSGQYRRYISNQSSVKVDELADNISKYIRNTNVETIASSTAIINNLKNMPAELSNNLGNALDTLFRTKDDTLYTKTQIYDENGPTDRYNIMLTRKGAYLVNKLIELARKKQLGGNLNINSVKALANDYDQQSYEKIDKFAENYGDLTGDHYEYTESQMNDILNELIAMNVIDEDTGDVRWADLQTNQDVLDLWEEKLGGIRTRADGSVPVTIVNDETDGKTKTLYDYAKSMVTGGVKSSGIDYLNKLSNAARTNDPGALQALMNATNGLGYTGFLNAIQDEYDSIVSTMKTTSFLFLPEEEQQAYRNKKLYYERYFGLGQAKAQGLTDGEVDEMNKTQDDRNKTYQRDIDETKGVYLVSSPSRVYYDIGRFNVLGLQNGFMDTFEVFSKVSLAAIEGLTNESGIAMQAMINSLDDDTIQPTITPVFDGNGIQNGVTAMNRSFEGINSAVDATVQSFRDDTPNYNSRFDLLANAINGTNTLVNGLIQMLAEGDIVTVNVNAESDPNNIYELVVNTNREKFKQTGKNKLVY